MENQKPIKTGGMPKKLWLIIGALVVVAIIIIVVIATTQERQDLDTPRLDSEISDEEMMDDEYLEEEEFEIETISSEEGVSVVPGGDRVVEGRVINREGQEVQTDVKPMSPGAPQQTSPIEREELSEEVVQLDISAAGWNPDEFTVEAGSVVALSVSSTDEFTHIFKFDDESLQAVAVGVSAGQTRAITFNAPDTPGEYTFRCDVPGHARRGEVGVMIVE